MTNETKPALLSKLRAPVADERSSEQTAPGRQYHLLKTDPDVFQAVLSGAKTFEIRMNDRGYAVGDVLGLRETRFTGAEMRAGAPLVYTGRECQRFVSHVLTGYGLADGWCCLSFDLPHAGGASAPVAGEALAGYMVGTDYFRPDVLAAARIYAENRGLEVRTLRYADAAPQASADAPGHTDLMVLPESIDSYLDAAKAAPQDSEAECSCPSGNGSLRHPCAVHPASEASNPVDSEAWQGIEQMAAARYRVEPYGIGHKVVAGNGTRTLYTGPKYFCELIAARLTAAFLDGAFAALSAQPGAQKEANDGDQ